MVVDEGFFRLLARRANLSLNYMDFLPIIWDYVGRLSLAHGPYMYILSVSLRFFKVVGAYRPIFVTNDFC